MPMPLWWGQINKRVFNPRAVRNGKWQVIEHVGRSSGRTHRTPLEAHRVADGYVFVLVYGSRSDWVRNVLAAGSAVLEVDGVSVELEGPALLTAEQAFELLPPGTKRPPKMLRIDEFLHMSESTSS
jgi:deazaflavin-dependent oxidoreductase (nitroreductase family)